MAGSALYYESAPNKAYRPRFDWRSLSLRVRLGLLVVVAIVPVVAFSLVQRYVEYLDDVRLASDRTLELARSMSFLVDGELQAGVTALKTLRNSTDLQQGDLAAFREHAAAVIADQFPDGNILLLAENGRILFNTASPVGTELPLRNDMETTRTVFSTGQPGVSNVFFGAVRGLPVVAIDVPVKDRDGKITAVLSLNPRLTAFDDVIRHQHLPANWIVSIFDRRGTNVARVPNGDKFVGQLASDSFRQELLRHHEGVSQSTSREGVDLLSAYSHGERYGWAVAIGIPNSEILAPNIAAAIKTGAIGAAILAVSVGLASLVAQRITGPILSLRQLAAADWEKLPALLPTGLPEVDEVAAAFHSAELQRRRSREAELRLRDGIESIPEGLAIFDNTDRLVMCNEGYRHRFPCPPEQVGPGARFEDMLRAGLLAGHFNVQADQREDWIAAQICAHRDPCAATEQRLPDGRWMLVRNRPLSDGGLVGLRIDISALKEAQETIRCSEKRLRNSEMFLKRAQRQARLGSFLWELQTDLVEWSEETYRIFGVDAAEFIPTRQAVLELVHPDDRATVLAVTEEAKQGGVAPATFEYRVVRPDGSVRIVHRESQIIPDEQGRPRYLSGIFQDITDRRRTEEQLRQAQKMEAIGNLTGGMAHDFNNLLGIIVGNLGLAQEEIKSEPEIAELVGEALEAAWRGADLTRRLLAFARRQPLRPVQIDVNALVSDAVRLLRRLVGEDIEVSLNLGRDLWPVTADPAQLEAAITNLANNARDAMPRGGRLLIATDNRKLDADYAATHADVIPGDYVMIEISDTGVGMSPEIMQQIFEPFFTTKEAGKGTGLGLSMVFGFLRQSAGHVNVYSEFGKGTTFRLYLPRARDDELVAEKPEAMPGASGAGETILIVEDNPGMRAVVLRQLRDLGYRTLECDRATAALELLRRERVDLLLTDVVMPGGLDGAELAQIAAERFPSVKIVLTSGFPQTRFGENDALAGLPLLGKPYSKEELAAVLRACLEG